MFRKKKRRAETAALVQTELQALSALRPLPSAEKRAADETAMGGLQLAFLGDAVYELLVREFVCAGAPAAVQALHRDAVYYANASFQAAAADRLLPLFTEAEAAVFRRGRNAHAGHTPKNKTEAEYHKATGFEAVFGYLYLQGEEERIGNLFRAAVLPEEKEDHA